jgi:hypothetical protein
LQGMFLPGELTSAIYQVCIIGVLPWLFFFPSLLTVAVTHDPD